MPPIKRRQFLQGAGAALATLGFSQWKIQHQALRYAQVLAQGTPRKRALLIGISQYKYQPIGDSTGWAELPGAINDIEMQRELLRHRFGFQPGDIVSCTNKNATRDRILHEFENLIQWAKPGDVVVIHYSGHGSTVDDPDRTFTDHLNGTLVPWDSYLPPGGGAVDDITSGTLFLLMAALQTKNVTVVLDSCYSGGGARGNLIIRARPGQAELLLRGGGVKLSASDVERNYQEQRRQEWQRSRSRTDWITQRRQGLANGAALLAASRNQEAADATFGGDGHAGVFTYALTRHLWQQTRNEAMGTVLVATQAKTTALLRTLDGQKHVQTPEFQEKPNSGNQQQPTYFLSSFTRQQRQAAEAVVTKAEGNTIQMLLNGVEPQVLETFGKGAKLTLIDAQGQAQGTVTIGDRQGLTARGQITLKPGATIQPGALLQEQTRSIPADWSLRIGLDRSLGQEMAIAQQELPKIHARIVPVPLLQQEVHYILGRMTQLVHDALQERRSPNIPQVGSLGLFYSGLELLPDSFGEPAESLNTALQQRLQPKFKFLLAGRLLKLLLNPTSTRLNVKAAVRVAGAQEFVAQTIAVRGGQTAPVVVGASAKQIKVGEKIQIVVENNEAKALNCAIVFLSADGKVQPLPFASVVPAGRAIEIPGNNTTISMTPPFGIAEVMVVFSTADLDRAISQLQNLSKVEEGNRGEQANFAIDTLLEDLSETRSSSQSEAKLVSVDQMAALSVTFEIIQ